MANNESLAVEPAPSLTESVYRKNITSTVLRTLALGGLGAAVGYFVGSRKGSYAIAGGLAGVTSSVLLTQVTKPKPIDWGPTVNAAGTIEAAQEGSIKSTVLKAISLPEQPALATFAKAAQEKPVFTALVPSQPKTVFTAAQEGSTLATVTGSGDKKLATVTVSQGKPVFTALAPRKVFTAAFLGEKTRYPGWLGSLIQCGSMAQNYYLKYLRYKMHTDCQGFTGIKEGIMKAVQNEGEYPYVHTRVEWPAPIDDMTVTGHSKRWWDGIDENWPRRPMTTIIVPPGGMTYEGKSYKAGDIIKEHLRVQTVVYKHFYYNAMNHWSRVTKKGGIRGWQIDKYGDLNINQRYDGVFEAPEDLAGFQTLKGYWSAVKDYYALGYWFVWAGEVFRCQQFDKRQKQKDPPKWWRDHCLAWGVGCARGERFGANKTFRLSDAKSRGKGFNPVTVDSIADPNTMLMLVKSITPAPGSLPSGSELRTKTPLVWGNASDGFKPNWEWPGGYLSWRESIEAKRQEVAVHSWWYQGFGILVTTAVEVASYVTQQYETLVVLPGVCMSLFKTAMATVSNQLGWAEAGTVFDTMQWLSAGPALLEKTLKQPFKEVQNILTEKMTTFANHWHNGAFLPDLLGDDKKWKDIYEELQNTETTDRLRHLWDGR